MQIEDNKLRDSKYRTSFWNKKARGYLLGARITEVAYMTEKERDDMYWHKRPVLFKLDSGLWCYPSMDDEGNDGGALFMNNEEGCLPVL